VRTLWLIRHAQTAWNATGRIQGHTDVGLNAVGQQAACSWRLPVDASEWFVSPLSRAQQTAAAMAADPVTVIPALTEMNWGVWEGQSLAQLRAQLGDAMRINEDAGLDFRPDAGESPREVQARLREWYLTLDRTGPDVAVVTHKGVIRALLAEASGWDMRGKSPGRWQFDGFAHAVCIDSSGALSVGTINLSLQGPFGAGSAAS
jgi:2,3-bisphosphoglycerate-dependent phosphoglycerate mutase